MIGELAPVLLVLYFTAMFWIGISQAVEMSVASRTLRSVSDLSATSFNPMTLMLGRLLLHCHSSKGS